MHYLFDIRTLAFVAGSNQGFGHLVFDVSSLSNLHIFLHLFTAQRNMRDLLADPAALFAAFRIEAREHFVFLLWLVHDGGKRAEGALLQTN